MWRSRFRITRAAPGALIFLTGCLRTVASCQPSLHLRGMGNVMSRIEWALASARESDLTTQSVGVPVGASQPECIAFRSAQQNRMKLYSAWFCPFAQCTWAHMEELSADGFEFQLVEVDPYKPRSDGLDSKQAMSIEEKAAKYPEFVTASPRGVVPAIDHDGVYASACTECCQYLVDLMDSGSSYANGARRTWFGTQSSTPPSMMPADSAERARVWAFWEHCQTHIVPWFYKALMFQEAEDQEGALKMLLKGVRVASALLGRQSRCGFFLGERYSVADLALAPWWERLPILKHYRGFEVPNTAEYERLRDWWAAVGGRPSYQRTMADTARLIANYREYADGTATSTVARSIVPSR